MTRRALDLEVPRKRGLIIVLAVAVALITFSAFAYLAVVANTTPTVDRALGKLTTKPADKLPGFAVEALHDVYDNASSLSPMWPPPVVEHPVVAEPERDSKAIKRARERRAAAAKRAAAKKRAAEQRAAEQRASKAKAARAARQPVDIGPRWRPGRGDVHAELLAHADAVQRCYDEGMVPGRVEVTITVEPSGKVSYVAVKPRTSTSTCVARLMRKLELPPFAPPALEIRQVYNFR